MLGCYCSACGKCFFCRRGRLPQVRRGAGVRPRQDARLAPGRAGRAGAGPAREPHAAARARGHVRRRGPVRRRRDGHRLPRGRRRAGMRARRRGGGARPRPGRPLRRAGGARPPARRRWSRSTRCEDRLAMARRSAPKPVHLTEEDPRAAVKAATYGRGVDVAVDAVGHPDALELACRLARKAGTVSATGRLRRAHPGAHGNRLDQGADAHLGARERDRARGPRARR